MDAKTYLSQVIKLENSLHSKKEQLIILDSKMFYISPAPTSVVGSGASAQYTVDKLPLQIANKEQLENDILTIERELIIKKAEILKTIDKIDDDVIGEILYMRYLLKMPINKISERLGEPIKWVYHKHTEGVNIVQVGLYASKPFVNVKYHVYDLIIDEIIFTGSAVEIANYLNVKVHLVHAAHNQRSKIDRFGIVETKHVEVQVHLIRTKGGL